MCTLNVSRLLMSLEYIGTGIPNIKRVKLEKLLWDGE